VKSQTHLSDFHHKDLRHLLKIYKALFDSTLEVYPYKKFDIEMEKGSKPKCSRPYAVMYRKYILRHSKKEVEHLIEVGVLEPQGKIEWVLPTFIIPK
jgi:hypothetical protein